MQPAPLPSPARNAIVPLADAEARQVTDWLVGPAVGIADINDFFGEFANRLNGAGIPVERMMTAIETLHADYAGISRVWTRESGINVREYPYMDDDSADSVYRRSPFYTAHLTQRPVRCRMESTPDTAYGIVPDLRAAGITDYICMPILFSNGDENGISFATAAPGGFSDANIAAIEAIGPALARHLEIRTLRRRMDFLLRFYVGDEPAERILSGVVRRGQVTQIRSAILVADMRHFTQLTHDLAPDAVVGVLNRFFDCLVPPIEAEGGEVLKFMGDGLLAIFRDRSDDSGSAAQAAYSAAVAALRNVTALDNEKVLPLPLEAGIALHHGRAAYGNVGAGARLDFTVIGTDVNIASRIATLNRPLGERLLMSEAFVNQLWSPQEAIGDHAVVGVPHPLKLYRPAAAIV